MEKEEVFQAFSLDSVPMRVVCALKETEGPLLSALMLMGRKGKETRTVSFTEWMDTCAAALDTIYEICRADPAAEVRRLHAAGLACRTYMLHDRQDETAEALLDVLGAAKEEDETARFSACEVCLCLEECFAKGFRTDIRTRLGIIRRLNETRGLHDTVMGRYKRKVQGWNG